MIFLTYVGLPPSLALWVTIWAGQLKVAWILVAMRQLAIANRRELLTLAPSEQYRRHLDAGGYRP